MNSAGDPTNAGVATKAVNATKNAAQKALNYVKNVSVQNINTPESPLFWILLVIFVLIIVYCIQIIMKSREVLSSPGNVKAITQEQVAIYQSKFPAQFKDRKTLRQAAQEQQITEQEDCLMNFQPLTVIQPGFLGPIKDGVYEEQEGVYAALRMGARCFILPIDYFDKDTMAKPFPEPNKPCLLYRDSSDTIRSINAGSIAKVAQAISDTAWSDNVFQKNDPFILVLYFVRTPKENTAEYLKFLSQVAVDLAPLSAYLLTQTPEGVFNRQAKQESLLFMNTNQLEKKLLVFCNADTSGFRTSKKDFNHTYLPKEDLDYWTHLRIFKNNADTPLGVTSLADQTQVARGMVDKTSYFTTMPNDAKTQKTAVDGTKEKFTISLSTEGTNPSLETATMVLDTYGAQAVPLYLTDYNTELVSLLGKWQYAWRAKPKQIRYIRPAPIQIAQQSPTTNANGGMVTSPQ